MIQSIWLALIAGVVHHFAVQYPKQATLFETLPVFTLLNAFFLVLDLRSRSWWHSGSATVSQVSLDTLIFNGVYVQTILTSIRFLMLSCSRQCTTFIFAIEGSRASLHSKQPTGLYESTLKWEILSN